MAHWDVSSELRGEHGRWSHGGAAIERMARDAGGSTAPHASYGETIQHFKDLPVGGSTRINGVLHGRNKKGFWVIHKWEALPEDKGQQKQQNLGRIARKQKGKEK